VAKKAGRKGEKIRFEVLTFRQTFWFRHRALSCIFVDKRQLSGQYSTFVFRA